VYAEVYGHIPKIGYLLSLQFTFNTNTAFNYVNKQLNESRTTTYTPAIYISQNKVTYSLYFNIGPTYTVNTTSLQQLNNNSHGFFSNAGFYTKLPLNFFIGSAANYNYNARNQVFDHDFKRLLLKSFIGKSFLKDEGLKLSITGNDLLNQNTGYNRTGSADSYSEERNTTIRRYFMFSVTWDFSKFGKSLQKSGS